MDEWAGLGVTVMGLGRFGGGVGVVRSLAAAGADVLVTDLDAEAKLVEPLHQIADLIDSGAVRTRLGEHNVADFTTCDLVVANPAVPRPWENRFLRAAEAAGVKITTEIRLVVEQLQRKRVIGITGSAGKSTTAAMIHHVLQEVGERAHLGGNIGGSLLPLIATGSIQRDDWIVLELSSAMLHWLGSRVGFEDAEGWSPGVAVLTNIAENHLDWHGSFEHYRSAKLSIFAHQQTGDIALRGEETLAQSADFPIALGIPGRHNIANARLALAAASAVSRQPAQALAHHLTSFRGLPHRLQLVAERDGVRYFNDSKSTTPASAILAVEAFESQRDRSIHLILGGYDKGSDLTDAAHLIVHPKVASIFTIGVTGERIAEMAQAAGTGKPVHACGTLETAVEHAHAAAAPGDVVLLSPACASWDQFTNYEERGDAFARLARSASDALAAP